MSAWLLQFSIEYCLKSPLLCTMSFTTVVRHIFATLLLSPSLTLPGARSDHPLPVCCYSQDKDEVWQLRLFRLWTCCVEQFVIWTLPRRLSFYISLTAEVTSLSIGFYYFTNFYNTPLCLSTVYVNGALQIIIIIIIIIIICLQCFDTLGCAIKMASSL